MKTVYVRQYYAIFTQKDREIKCVDLSVVPFKPMPYDEFRTFFNRRAKNLVGLDVIVEHSTNSTARVPLTGDGKSYELWRWYILKDGKRNVWECITKGRKYRQIHFAEGFVRLTNGGNFGI